MPFGIVVADNVEVVVDTITFLQFKEDVEKHTTTPFDIGDMRRAFSLYDKDVKGYVLGEDLEALHEYIKENGKLPARVHNIGKPKAGIRCISDASQAILGDCAS